MNGKALKQRQRLIAWVISAVFFAISCVMAVTTVIQAQESALVSAVLTTDKDSYNEGEDINIVLKVTNNSTYDVGGIISEITLPDGLTLKSGGLSEGEYSLAAGKDRITELTAYIEKLTPEETTSEEATSEELTTEGTTTPEKITTSGETTTPEQTTSDEKTTTPDKSSNPKTGDSHSNIWIILAILSGIIFLAFSIKNKKLKKIFSIFLCMIMLFSILPADAFANNGTNTTASGGNVIANKDITVNGVKKTITAKVVYTDNEPSEGEEVTVTFDTGDGTPVEPITVKKGETIEQLPQSFGAGKAFMGWFTDTGFTDEFFSDTPVNEDMTVYASFKDSSDDYEPVEDTTYYEENCDENHSITLISDEVITADNINSFITLFAYTGDTPERFTVTPNGENEYTIVPETPYTKGCMYRMTANDGVHFKGLNEVVSEYTFKIYKEESNIVELRDGIKYLDKAKLTETPNEYEYIIQKDYYEANTLAVDDVICIGDGTNNITDDCLFVKIIDSIKDDDEYYIQTDDCDVEDVYDKVDIYFTDPAQNKYLVDGIDTAALEQEIYNSEGAKQLNYVLAAVLAESETVKEELDGESLVGSTLDDDRLKDFSDYAHPKEDTLADLAKRLGKNLKVSVKIGEAENNNFTYPNPDYWTAITFTLGYKGNVKGKLKVDATFTITEYINVSLQGYKQFEFKWFDTPELEFNYAANMYTQTDIELQVLVCSVGANSYRNITDEVTKMLRSDKENDTQGLVKEVQDMLNKKGGYIELCRLPLFSTAKPLALFQLNFELDFVVKMSFAGGIGSKFSVLDARQVGAYGNSKEKEFSMYKNKLIGADRYSFDLTLCGYTGIKMGIAGQLTVSFIGLRRLGEVGVEVQVGAYLDIYGYARYHVVKPDHRYDTVYSTLMGGFYLEGGIYLEVNLVAESKVFNIRVDAPLIPECKWPLFSMGDKKLVVCLNDPVTPIVFYSNGSSYASIDVNDLSPMSGQVVDITTGVLDKNATIPWNKVTLKVSGKGFRVVYDRQGRHLTYDQPYSSYRQSSDECTAQVHYYGNTLQFTKTADSKASTTKTVRVIWYDKSRVNFDDIGKMYTVNFFREVDGEKTLVGTRQVPAGNYAGKFNTDGAVDSWKYMDEEWESDPYFTPVSKDNTEIVYHAKRAQALVSFTYYDVNKDIWTTEVRAVNVGDDATPPDIVDNENIKFSGWYSINGVPQGYYNMFKYAANNMKKIDYKVDKYYLKSGLPTDKALCSVTSSDLYGAERQLFYSYNKEYHQVIYYYRAGYTLKNMSVKFKSQTMYGEPVVREMEVPYGKSPDMPYAATPLGKTLLGYSSDGGKTIYKLWSQLPKVYEDTVYEAIYKTNVYNVDLFYYDDIAREFKIYKTLKVDGGTSVPKSELDEAFAACNWQEGTSYQFIQWCEDQYGYNVGEFELDKLIYRDLRIRPIIRRNVRINLDAGDGRNLFYDYLDSFDSEDYEVTISRWAVKDSDKYNDYEPIGWKDNKTGQVYSIGQQVKIDYATTLTAIYKVNPKTYTVKVSTPYGELLNGETTDTFTGGYDDYLAFVEKYNNYIPQNVEGEGYTLEYQGSSSIPSADGLSLEIIFGNWKKNVHRHTLKLDVNGGKLTGNDERTEAYGAEIKLSDMAEVSKTDDLRDYIFGGWIDEDGNIYGADDTITLTKDVTLTAIWIDGDYQEYTITFILDGTVIERKNYHYGDMLPVFGAPSEAAGYIFNGWSWSGAAGALVKQPETMPASGLTAIATTTKCYITYEFDGQIYKTKEVAKIGDTIPVIDKPVKDYYDVTEWSADGIVVTDGKFVMPAHDVIFRATSSPKFYDISITIDGSISEDSPLSEQYMNVVTLPVPPQKSGYTYYWKSDDVDIYEENGEYKFIMPHNDVSVECIYTTATHNIYYIIDGETEPYCTISDVPVGKEMFSYIDLPQKDGYMFNETWICLTDISLVNKEGIYTMPDSDVYFWGRYCEDTENTIILGIEISIDGVTDNYYSLFVNKGEIITLPDIKRNGYTLSYESETLTVTDGKVRIPDDGTDEITLTAKFTKK